MMDEGYADLWRAKWKEGLARLKLLIEGLGADKAVRLDDIERVLVEAYVMGQGLRQVGPELPVGYEAERMNAMRAELRRQLELLATGPKFAFIHWLNGAWDNYANAGLGVECVASHPEKGLLAEASTSPEAYEKALREPVRGLWSGVLDIVSFTDMMEVAMRRHLYGAFLEGLKVCGFTEDDLNTDEITAIWGFINEQLLYVFDLFEYISTHNKASGAPLHSLDGRVALWVPRWDEAFTRGQGVACGDQKAEWTLGAAEHCASCLKLSGKVKRMSWWIEQGILPRVAGAAYLECKGYNCQCALVLTKKPQSKGRMPKLP